MCQDAAKSLAASRSVASADACGLQRGPHRGWAKIVLKTQHQKEIAMEQSKKEKIAAEKKAKEKAVEIRLTRENFKQVVLDELDSGQRAARLLYGMRTWLGKSFPNVLLEPEEIHLSNAEWNFTALANLFVQHTSLQPDQLNFVTDYNELYDLEEKWKQVDTEIE